MRYQITKLKTIFDGKLFWEQTILTIKYINIKGFSSMAVTWPEYLCKLVRVNSFFGGICYKSRNKSFSEDVYVQ